VNRSPEEVLATIPGWPLSDEGKVMVLATKRFTTLALQRALAQINNAEGAWLPDLVAPQDLAAEARVLLAEGIIDDCLIDAVDTEDDAREDLQARLTAG
jgi:hypothetical protein